MLTVLAVTARAQTNEYVIQSVSGNLQTSTSIHDFAIGEVEISVRTDGTSSITGGFLQPDFVTLHVTNTTNFGNVLVFPNPAQGMIRIQFDQAGNRTVRFSNVNGEVLTQFVVLDRITEVDLSAYASGFYFIEIQSQKELLNRQIKILKLQ